MDQSKLNMTEGELIADLVRICYRLILRFSSVDATTEEKAMLPDLLSVIIRLLNI